MKIKDLSPTTFYHEWYIIDYDPLADILKKGE